MAKTQTEVKGFLGWLESYLGIIGGGPHAQDRSSQSYYEHDYESFLAVLKRNSKKLAVDSARREPAEALRAEFEGSMGKLPLRELILADGRADRCDGVQAVRYDGGGDQDS